MLYAAVGVLVPIAWIALYSYAAGRRYLLTDDEAPRYARFGARLSLVPVLL